MSIRRARALRPVGRAVAAIHMDARSSLLRAMPKGAVCAEIGVWKGDFSARIMRETRPSKIHLIDPWLFQPGDEYRQVWWGSGSSQEDMDHIYAGVRDRFHAEVARGTVEIHRMTSAQAADTFAADYFDWVYVDGDHLYEFVRADLHNYLAKLRVGGLLAGDDYYETSAWGDGVRRAVDEFVSEGHCEKLKSPRDQFILRRP